MVQARPRLQTFEDFLADAEAVDGYYELENGELVKMPPESDANLQRAMELYEALKAHVDRKQIRLQGVAIATPGQPKNRYPDLTVLRPEHPKQMQSLGYAAITLDMLPPLLVVEVVSPGSENHRRDYFEKRNQYEWRGIPEYWIVDPRLAQVTVYSMSSEGYQEAIYSGEAVVTSPSFSDWQQTADDMLIL
ncbi:MAG: Uma2 family endonuclease [Cyanobacteria bacterium P01_D01_bin.6]